jgi:hypothetical protein
MLVITTPDKLPTKRWKSVGRKTKAEDQKAEEGVAPLPGQP